MHQVHKDKPTTYTNAFMRLRLRCDMCPKTSEEKYKMSRVSYVSDVGNLMYAMICTRSNIYSVV